MLSALIGIERQVRQKAAGFRTHVLVGTGSAAFTLVSAFGFTAVLGEDVVLDPSRIAAQIVTGIGFLGAGVIFTRRDVVRGLTTAATIWVSAAVGMAAGSGMVALAVALTALHLFTLVALAPLVRRIPTADRNRVLRVAYPDGHGILRQVLETATAMGFTASVIGTSREPAGEGAMVVMDIRFRGRPPLRDLVPAIGEVDGVRSVRIRASDGDDGRDDDDQD